MHSIGTADNKKLRTIKTAVALAQAQIAVNACDSKKGEDGLASMYFQSLDEK